MSQTLRFHLDASVQRFPAVAAGLRRRGIDVTTAAEAGLLDEEDLEQWRYAKANGRALFTNDEDFLALARQDEAHCGVIYCKQGARSLGFIINALGLFWELVEPGDMHGKVEYI